MHEELTLLFALVRKAEEGKIDGYALDIPFLLSRWLFPQSASRARAHSREQELGILERNYLLSAISEWTGISQRVIHDHIYNHRRDLKGRNNE